MINHYFLINFEYIFNRTNFVTFSLGDNHGRRNSGAGGQLPPPPIFCQPKKFKIIKTTTYKSVYRNMVKIC